MTKPGRGLPYAPGKTMATISPRLTSSHPYPRRSTATLDDQLQTDPCATPNTDGDIRLQSLRVECRAPKSAPAASLQLAAPYDASERVGQRRSVTPLESPDKLHVTIQQTPVTCNSAPLINDLYLQARPHRNCELFDLCYI